MINNIKDFYDAKIFPGVSSETRTAIINTVGFDIEGATLEEGGKYSQEELTRGLQYLLMSNPDLKDKYVENEPKISGNTNNSNNQSDKIVYIYDPFVMRSDDLLLWSLLL